MKFWERAARLYFRMAEWFASNEPGTPVPEWCELSWPPKKEKIEELLKIYEEEHESPCD